MSEVKADAEKFSLQAMSCLIQLIVARKKAFHVSV